MKKKLRALRMESLEGRALMAGDVSASIQLGSLKIEGDQLANDIAVADLGGGKVEIVGQNGTKVNGVDSVVLDRFTANVKMELRGGDDVVSWKGIDSHTSSRFKIETGAGNDTIVVDQLYAGLAEVESGLGNDTVRFGSAKANLAKISTGDGDDAVLIGASLDAASALISVVNLKVETGAGNDRVDIQHADFFASMVKAETGAGNDSVLVRDAKGSASLKVSTGLGTDNVTIEDTAFKTIDAELGAGDGDTLTLQRVTSTKAKLQGGLGTADKLVILDSVLGKLERSGFEIV